MLDATLRVRSANLAFYRTFQVLPEETENHLIYELGNGQWDIPALRILLEDIVPKNSVFNDFELVHTFPNIGRRVMVLNARELKAGDHDDLLVLAMEDVTEKRAAEEAIAAANAELSAIEAFAQNVVDTVREPFYSESRCKPKSKGNPQKSTHPPQRGRVPLRVGHSKQLTKKRTQPA